MTAKKKKSPIVIVDDHPLVRRGLMDLISNEPDLEVVGEAADADTAMKLVKQKKPELLVIDLSLGGKSGLDLIKRINTHDSKIKMLVASMYDEVLFAERCIRAGASGYVNKETATDRVIEAIREVLDGEIYVSPAITRRVVRSLAGGKSADDSPISSLTDRELEVFGLIGHGNTTREISQKLNLSVKTIETYREHIKQKFDISTSAELSRHAVQWVLENG